LFADPPVTVTYIWDTPAIVTFNDGTIADSLYTALVPFYASYQEMNYVTYCIDLTHTVTNNQTYSVYQRDDLASNFWNGGAMAALYQDHGVAGGSDPTIAAAVQLVLWDLCLNHYGTGLDLLLENGIIHSADYNLTVYFTDDDPQAIYNLAVSYLASALQAPATVGYWLDASAQGEYVNRGQSLMSLEPTSTTLTSSPNPSFQGGNVALTAIVSGLSGGSTPTGSVDFYDGTTMLGSVDLGNTGQPNQATFTYENVNETGDHTFTATYKGDNTFAGSSGNGTHYVNLYFPRIS
jgi:hypothetical protein